MEYTGKQLMAIALANEIEDGKVYIIGTGLPLIGASLAKHTTAPNARLLFETGILEGNPLEVPTSVSDLRINREASVLWPQYRYFGFQTIMAQRNAIDAGFLGGAEIDAYGNLNSTAIGDYLNPKTRFSGSGGANGIATYCDTIIVMKHEKRRFVEKVDYCTSPGWIDGPDGRAKRGLNPNKGPRTVVTQYGVFKFGDDKRMYMDKIFPGVSKEEVIENTGFAIDVSRAKPYEVPGEEIFRVLVEEVDPDRVMI
ncbi:MAG: CoA-transferase subunit beta [Peptoniphilaceae bacterium]|nr:CoA-transferase subunit beta [Peptoniphilaceae bacterium]